MQTNTNNSDYFIEFKKSKEYEAFIKNPVAYFCAEYALDSALPTYAGGLGILSGDYIREIGEQSFPLVSVGLLYKKAQSVLTLGEHAGKSSLQTVFDNNHEEIVVTLPIEGRIIKAKAFMWQKDKAKVYLLDTDIEDNDPRDRVITNCLYDEDRDIRLKQEIILGIGGFRLLARLGYHSSVYHLNEGHSAFLALELVRHEMEHQHATFHDACEYAKKHILFTNHTLVLAGQELFSSTRVAYFLEEYAKEIGVDSMDIAKLGSTETDASIFSMTTLSFRLSEKWNGVSQLHTEKAKKIWPNQPMANVTNGVFVKRWDKMQGANVDNIWQMHLENKRKLLNLVQEKAGVVWGETDLVFAWARRLVEYKQPLLFLDDVEEILQMAKDSPVPIRIVYSGPTSGVENQYITKIRELADGKLKGILFFIPNYSVEISEILIAGADIWLNTPMVGFEACGTSGMKAGLNGALALSTRDGWVYEVVGDDIGWVVEQSTNGGELRSIVAKNIIPLYHEHLQNGGNSAWAQKMHKARNLILEDFSMSRALREYIEKLYIPTLGQKHTHNID